MSKKWKKNQVEENRMNDARVTAHGIKMKWG